jgi:hypothetical protein
MNDTLTTDPKEPTTDPKESSANSNKIEWAAALAWVNFLEDSWGVCLRQKPPHYVYDEDELSLVRLFLTRKEKWLTDPPSITPYSMKLVFDDKEFILRMPTLNDTEDVTLGCVEFQKLTDFIDPIIDRNSIGENGVTSSSYGDFHGLHSFHEV